ncbi:MAG: hypothetical protein Q8Q52_00960 [Acidimicrobiia bacterium]|nr:hypothetical protein [Acidimicrobiia bacterium]
MIGRLVASIGLLACLALVAAKALLRSRADDDLDEIDMAVVLARKRFRTRARPFLGGTMLVLASTTEMDLRRALPGPTGIELAVAVIGGHLRLIVPPEWNVAVTVQPRMSLVTHLPEPEKVDAPWLRMIGRAWFSRVEVIARPVPTAVVSLP